MAKFQMKVGLNVVNHLGLHLYSNVPAVLSEAIANAYDADATEVNVSFDGDTVVISDNGNGMTVEEVNRRFLYVGYSRREMGKGGAESERLGRAVMGRKGIGKLSLFSIADDVKISTRRFYPDETLGDPLGFQMSREGIQRAARLHEDVYEPTEIDVSETDIPTVHGTVIELTGLDRKITRGSIHALRTRVARRFSIIGKDFEVRIGGEPIGPEDRDFYKFLQFVWVYDDVTEDLMARVAPEAKLTRLESNIDVDGIAAAYGDEWPNELKEINITGWIGSVTKPGQLTEDNNSISILARGKLIHENALASLGTAEIYNSYLVGEIGGDFLDLDEFEDVATSDRQNVKEDEPRVQALLEKLGTDLRIVGSGWSADRAEAQRVEILRRFADVSILAEIDARQALYLAEVIEAIRKVPNSESSVAQEFENAVISVARQRWIN